MEREESDFSKQLMREKLRHRRTTAYDAGDGIEDRHAWMPPERHPWYQRGRGSFQPDYPIVPRFAVPTGSGLDGPMAKRIRGDWVDLHSSRMPHFMPVRAPWQPSLQQEFYHCRHHHQSPLSTQSIPPSSSSSSAASSSKPPNVGGSEKIGNVSSSSSSLNHQQFLGGKLDGEKMKEGVLKKNAGEFFVKHKDEEWFKYKYHPNEFHKRITDRKEMVKRRRHVFEKLMEFDFIDKVNLEVGRVKDIVKILDTAVILMEGGSDLDLKTLDQEEDSESQSQENKDLKIRTKPVPSMPVKFTEPLKLERGSRGKTSVSSDAVDDTNISDSGSISDSDEEQSTGRDKALAFSPSSPLCPPHSNNEEKNGDDDDDDVDDDDAADGESPNMATTDTNKTEEGEVEEVKSEPTPKPLHKTVSLFLRNLPTNIIKTEIEELCGTYPGFLRVALQDPQPENKFLRRAWVTFEPWVNVKDVCWNMSSAKLKECDLKPTVNSDLKQRVRTINGLVCHKSIAKQDVKHIVKVIQNLDALHGVWDDGEDDNDDENSAGGGDDGSNKKEIFGFVSKNPLLKNITDFLVDEGSYEEEALLDKSGSYWDEYDDRPKPAHAEVFIEKDTELLKALDRMIIYLRIVHSLDYYVAADYLDEDSMPHKCGIIHVRASKPTHKVTQNDVNEWMTSFEAKISNFTGGKFWLNGEEMSRIGKNVETEMEKFIAANTQEISKDKWLCPLSGKKFKGPDFVRKHIKTKHADKVEEVKMEVEYFNNYLRDARRPQSADTQIAITSSSGNQEASSQSTQNIVTPTPPSSYVPRFVHHYPPVRRPIHRANIVYRPPYNEFRVPGETYRPRDRFIPRRGRYEHTFR